ncbi:MAG: DUF3035 domain-containing protein [Pseudomonadota bacterium]
MRAARGITAVAAAALLVLAGCGGDDNPRLMNLRSSTNGPDEFGILPPKALDLPEDLTTLPEPTPGGENRTDPQPLDDAVVALGGTAQRGTGVPAGDSALYAQTGRFGVTPGIRQTLAGEDLEWRRDNNGRILEKLFKVNVYYRAYRKDSLDQEAELARWRKAGARNPSAPPVQTR